MSVTFGIAVYFMIWWIVLFAVLPFGRPQTQDEAGDIVPGSEPSAPTRPRCCVPKPGSGLTAEVV